MMSHAYADLAALADGRAVVDVACPLCGPDRVRKVLRLWSLPGFISYLCARCGEHGYVRENERVEVDAATQAAMFRAREAIAVRVAETSKDQRRIALTLWSMRRPIAGTVAERYLRKVRSISCPLPPTLGFLPARDDHPPALIAAFGMAQEAEPGRLCFDEKVLSACT
ncbi:hypothetical protein [Mesorhizobium sp.]|uniref:DUF7146 domain-containing protein n=1 Tax=Mesorhizobium sp. TaxID=1871066 RepID=UPI000FE8728D|nr:hypothetical protein [Mesorhizobium sp.]RWN58466.1 MAG: hypothetical protein EOS00_21280 [Mesorhizobium sp.]